MPQKNLLACPDAAFYRVLPSFTEFFLLLLPAASRRDSHGVFHRLFIALSLSLSLSLFCFFINSRRCRSFAFGGAVCFLCVSVSFRFVSFTIEVGGWDRGQPLSIRRPRRRRRRRWEKGNSSIVSRMANLFAFLFFLFWPFEWDPSQKKRNNHRGGYLT